MSHTAVVRAGQNNTVTVKPNSPSVVKVEQADQNNVSVSAGFDINITNIEGSFTETITDSINVTNEDVAIGDARNRQYSAGTTVEEILRDILDPDEDPELALTLTVNPTTLISDANQTVTDQLNIEWGYIPIIENVSFTISDPDELTNSDDDLILISNAYSLNPSYSSGSIPTTNWHDLEGSSTSIGVGTPDLSSYINGDGYSHKFSFKLRLPFLRAGVNDLSFSNAVIINMIKKSFMFASSSDVRGGSSSATLNGLFGGPKSIVNTNGRMTFQAESSSSFSNYFTYIAIPESLSIDVSNPQSIQAGNFNIAEQFTEVDSSIPYTVSEVLDGEIVTYDYRLYQSTQPEAFQEGQRVSVELDL